MKLSTQSVKRRYLLFPLVLLGLWLAIEIFARLGVEMLWFEEVGYLPMYLLRLKTQGLLGIVVLTLTAVYLLGNLALAQRLNPTLAELNRQQAAKKRTGIDLESPQVSTVLNLHWLLPLTLSLSLSIGAILVHYLWVAVSQWDIDFSLPVAPPAPVLFRPEAIWQIGKQLGEHSSMAVGVGILSIAMLIYPRFLIRSIALILSISIAWVVSQQWMRVLPYFQATTFGHIDPVFDRDISAYVFGLPVAELMEFWLMGMCLFGFITVLLTYLLSGDSLSQGRFLGFSGAQQRHLYGLGGALMLVVSFSDWISCYELLYSPRGVSYGASFTDINVQLPVDRALGILALAIGVYLLWRSTSVRQINDRPIRLVGLYLIIAIGTTTILPAIVQALLVQPNELAREAPYIQRTIALTRQAFGLDNIVVNTFNPQANLTEQKIQANDRIIRNIRLWDKQPLLATNRQLQQIRLYYRFLDADFDRYTLASEPQALPTTPLSLALDRDCPHPNPPDKEQQQVLIAARELDYTAVPKQAQTWVNEHLIYTHGYGFTLSPVNRAAPGGLPEYLVKDIGMSEERPLTTSGAARSSIPIGQPRIYYGENTNTYVMTGTKLKELDYPSGNDNVYNVYDGRGGINLGSLGRRLLFGTYLNDWRMVFTPEFLPDTKL